MNTSVAKGGIVIAIDLKDIFILSRSLKTKEGWRDSIVCWAFVLSYIQLTWVDSLHPPVVIAKPGGNSEHSNGSPHQKHPNKIKEEWERKVKCSGKVSRDKVTFYYSA